MSCPEEATFSGVLQQRKAGIFHGPQVPISKAHILKVKTQGFL